MINAHFYTADSLTPIYTGKTFCYPIKDRWKVLEWREYEVVEGDTMYSLAARLFGENQEYQWVIIADINPLRLPDELVPGEIIKLPSLIVSEVNKRRITYGQTTSTTIRL